MGFIARRLFIYARFIVMSVPLIDGLIDFIGAFVVMSYFTVIFNCHRFHLAHAGKTPYEVLKE